MKSEKGITLISLILYIELLAAILAILLTVSNYFNNNIKYIEDIGKNMSGLNKFNMYFIEDVKNNTDIYSITNDQIVFEDGTTYTFVNKSIYRNKVKICENIYSVVFSNKDETDVNNFTKKIITVNMTITGTKLFQTESDYVLKYW